MLNSILANVIAGLGLFFSGLRMVDVNLRLATGRQLRTVVSRLTQRGWVAGFVGVATGALVQSSSGIVFILVSLVSSNLTTIRRALPIVTWANVGCCALVFVAVLDLRLVILYLVGIAGAAFAFDRSHKSDALGAVFGIGMLFYGIELMKAGAEPLQQLPAFTSLLNGSGQSYALAFVGGAAFSFVTQSSVAVSILAIGFAQTGLMGAYPTMMALYGANVGSTFSRMVLSSTLKGSVRQLTAYQDLFKITGAVIFVSLLYAEAAGGVPLIRALTEAVSPRIDRQMALVFLLFNLVTAVLFTALQVPILRQLEQWLPADPEEDESRPRYLYEEAREEPATAIDLLEREHLRLARRLRAYPDAMRAGAGSRQARTTREAHAPFTAVAHSIEAFQHELTRHVGPYETERLTRLQGRLNLLVYLQESLRTLTEVTEHVPADSRLGRDVSMFVEALDFVLLALIDAIETNEPDVVETLVLITEDRGEFAERIRQEYLAGESGATPSDRAVLLHVTSTFERVIWMTHRLARLLEGGVGARDGAPPALPIAGIASTASS